MPSVFRADSTRLSLRAHSVLMPPKLEQKGRLMIIKVYRVEELPAMDPGRRAR
jgi:hypothetical protein